MDPRLIAIITLSVILIITTAFLAFSIYWVKKNWRSDHEKIEKNRKQF